MDPTSVEQTREPEAWPPEWREFVYGPFGQAWSEERLERIQAAKEAQARREWHALAEGLREQEGGRAD